MMAGARTAILDSEVEAMMLKTLQQLREKKLGPSWLWAIAPDLDTLYLAENYFSSSSYIIHYYFEFSITWQLNQLLDIFESWEIHLGILKTLVQNLIHGVFVCVCVCVCVCACMHIYHVDMCLQCLDVWACACTHTCVVLLHNSDRSH